MYLPIHKKPSPVQGFDRLDMLWERYPQYHERTTFAALVTLLEEHESYGKDFDDVRLSLDLFIPSLQTAIGANMWMFTVCIWWQERK